MDFPCFPGDSSWQGQEQQKGIDSTGIEINRNLYIQPGRGKELL